MIQPGGPTTIRRDRFWVTGIATVSVAALLAVGYLILGPRDPRSGSAAVAFLPHVNAALNGTVALLLAVGYWFIRRRQMERHRAVMLAAFVVSCLFLASYLTYHSQQAGPRPYDGTVGWFYYPLLLTHVLLAAGVVPLAMLTLYRGWTTQIRKHRRVARITLPIWLYVSVSGVAVYLLLYT